MLGHQTSDIGNAASTPSRRPTAVSVNAQFMCKHVPPGQQCSFRRFGRCNWGRVASRVLDGRTRSEAVQGLARLCRKTVIQGADVAQDRRPIGVEDRPSWCCGASFLVVEGILGLDICIRKLDGLGSGQRKQLVLRAVNFPSPIEALLHQLTDTASDSTGATVRSADIAGLPTKTTRFLGGWDWKAKHHGAPSFWLRPLFFECLGNGRAL